MKILLKDKDHIADILFDQYKIPAENYTISESDDDESFTVHISEEKTVDGAVKIKTEDNDMEAYLYLYPPIGGGREITYEDIMAEVSENGITYNLNNDAISEALFIVNDNTVVFKKLIASGMRMRPGRDAVITLNFSKTGKRTKINADGTVDFKNISNIIDVRKSDAIVLKKPATNGSKGMTVKGVELLPPPGKDISLTCGEGVVMNATGTSYIAAYDGYVELKGSYIAVHEVYFVNGNVDFSTGNISFNGTVHIKGDVLAGFKVHAGKDVFVDGICNDCEIIAQNINIKTGIKSSGRENLFKARESITVGYCENAKICAKQSVTINKYAFNCDIYSGGTIDATSGDGIIAGGMVKAFSEVNVNQLGTQGRSNFSIYMGTKYYIDDAIEILRKQRAELTDNLNKMRDLLSMFDLNNPKVAGSYKISKIVKLTERFEDLISQVTQKENELSVGSKADDPKVKVNKLVFEGVSLIFFNLTVTVKEMQENMVYYLNRKYNEIAWISLKDAQNIELEEDE